MATVQDLARRWAVTLVEPMPGASCSEVWWGRAADGGEVVIKLPKPDDDEVLPRATLEAFAAHGGVAILDYDAESGAALMPRLRPGTSLDVLDDLDGVDVCARIIQELRRAPAVEAPRLETWMRELQEGDPGDFLVGEAQRIALRLFETTPRRGLLHGDLHHGNIVASGDGWTAIDPKGVFGDPSFEITGFMRNPLGRSPGPEGMRKRLVRFADRLGDPPDRLWGWAFAQTVLCHLWSSPGDNPLLWREAATAIYEVRRDFA